VVREKAAEAAVDDGAELRSGEVLEERYRIERTIGRGGTGIVYEASQITTGQRVAVKCLIRAQLSPEEKEAVTARFERETRLVAQLKHPHVVRLLDVGRGGGRFYMVLEYVQGETLASYLKRDDLTVATVKRLMLQVLDALACAHDLGVVHRDLKPHNIMVTTTGARPNAVVLDFGIAALAPEARDPSYWTLTTTGNVVGTPSYMAPEQLRGEVSPAADLYAFGLIFIECLIGRRAIVGDSVPHIMFLQMSDEPVPIPPMLAAHPLGKLLERATAKPLANRVGSARELMAELEALDLAGLDRAELRQQTVSDDVPTTDLTRRDTPGARAGLASSVQPTSTQLRRCRRCGTEVPRAFKFCGACGQTFDDETTEKPAEPARGERRQLTVLCCGLAKMAELQDSLEAEAMLELLQSYHRRCDEIVRGRGGQVVHYPSDGLLAYFGHPVAREDDARRAVDAALAIVDAVAALDGRAAQIAVHSGLVAVSGADAELALAGPMLTAAARLQAGAPPGRVLVSDAALRLVEGFFGHESVDAVDQPGARGLRAAVVTGRTTARSRLEGATAEHLSPFVGRGQELELLVSSWRAAASGKGQAVLLTGEAGMGKSRLALALRSRLGGDARWLEGRSSPETETTALSPLVEIAAAVFGAEDGSTDEERVLERIRRRAEALDLGPSALPILAKLLGLQSAPPIALAPPRLRQETVGTLLHLVLGLAEEQPAVVHIEDLHWADPSTLELLGMLVPQVRGSACLLLLTARPDVKEKWPAAAQLTQLHLAPLADEDAAELVRRIAGAAATGELVQDLVRRTDGVPLFVEELTKSMVEAPDRAPVSTASPGSRRAGQVPSTLHDSLMARLDHLGDAKQVAQLAAVVGRRFDRELIGAVAGLDDAVLDAALDRLVEAELVFRRGLGTRARYTFKHALVRDAAYQSLLVRTRREMHARIANALGERPGTPPEIVARHLEGAGDLERAVGMWLAAAQRALEASAFAEAVSHVHRGLALVQQIPASPQRDAAELGLQVTLGVPMMLMRGFAAPEVEAIYGRAHTLCQSATEAPQMFPAFWGLWIYYHVRGQYPRAQQHGATLLRLGQTYGDDAMLLGAHQALGASLLLRGQLRWAEGHFEAALGIYRADAHKHLAFLFGQDTAVFCGAHMSWIHWLRGDGDRARATMNEAMDHAAALAQPSSRGFAAHFAAALACMMGEVDSALAHASELSRLSQEQGMPHWEACARIDRGWAVAMAGDPTAGAASIRDGIGALMATGSQVAMTQYLAALSSALLAAGRLDEMSQILDEAKSFTAMSDEHFFEPTMWGLEADLLDRRGQAAAAATRRREAVQLAESLGELGVARTLAL
jgi:serine/threonine protein kinase/class 3 adenylate cyclase/predicted ATPase